MMLMIWSWPRDPKFTQKMTARKRSTTEVFHSLARDGRKNVEESWSLEAVSEEPGSLLEPVQRGQL